MERFVGDLFLDRPVNVQYDGIEFALMQKTCSLVVVSQREDGGVEGLLSNL